MNRITQKPAKTSNRNRSRRRMKKLITLILALALALALASSAQASDMYFEEIPMDEEVQTYLWNRCEEYGISLNFMVALIEHESSFQKYAESETGDYGLCQINMAANAEMIEEKQIYSLYDEYSNIDCAFEILTGLFEKHNDPYLVLMAYNMGEKGARNLWEQGIWQSDYAVTIAENAAALPYDDEGRESLK